SSTALTTSDFSSSVSLFGSSTFTLSPGTFGSLFSDSVVVFPSTTLSPGIVSLEPSGYVTVTSPLSPTVTVVPSGNVDLPFSSLFASSTALTTSDFSSSVSLFGSSTFTLSPGTFGSLFSDSVVVFPSTTLSPGIVSLEPSGYVTVTSPLSPTVTVVPSGNVDLPFSSLFASSTALPTSDFSSSVSLFGSSTFTLSPGTFGSLFSASLLPSTTLSPGIVTLEPSG